MRLTKDQETNLREQADTDNTPAAACIRMLLAELDATRAALPTQAEREALNGLLLPQHSARADTAKTWLARLVEFSRGSNMTPLHMATEAAMPTDAEHSALLELYAHLSEWSDDASAKFRGWYDRYTQWRYPP